MHEKVLFLLMCCCCFIYSACSTAKGVPDYEARARETREHILELGETQSGTAEANAGLGRNLETIKDAVSALDGQLERSEASARSVDESLEQGADAISEAAGVIEGVRARGNGSNSKKRGRK